MRTRLRLIPALLVTLAAASPALAQDTIKLKNGERMAGDAVAYDEATEVLTFRTADGVDHELALAELDGRSVYHVTRSKVPQDNAKGQLQLANFARDIELYAHAVRHYDYARKADPSLSGEVDKQMAVLKSEAAKWALGRANDAIGDNDLKEAEKWLTAIVEKLPDEPEAKTAQSMLDQYYTKVHQARDDELEKKQSIALETDLKTGKKYYDSMIEKKQKGLTGNSSQAVRNFEGAIQDGDRVQKELDKLLKKYTDADTTDVLMGYQEIVQQEIIEAHLHLASLYTTQTAYQKAQGEVNKALAIDPGNKDALAARARIETASSRGWW